MNGTKKAIFAGVIIAVIGILVLLGTWAASEGGNFKLVESWEQETYRSFTSYSKIYIKASAGKVVLKTESRDSVVVNYDYNDRYTPSFEEMSDILRIETGERKWYDFNFWFNDAPTMEIVIPTYLKAEVYLELNAGAVEICSGTWGPLIDIELNAGAISMGNVVVDQLNIEVNAGALQANRLKCKTVNYEINAGALKADDITSELFEGKVNAGGINVKKLDSTRIKLDVYAGAANLGLVGAQSEYSVSVRKSAGSCNVSSGSGADFSHVLYVYISAGSVEVTFGK